MNERISGLFFPLSSLKLSRALQAGENYLELRVRKGVSGLKGAFYRDGKEVKLTLEKLSDHQFCESFVDYYHFGSKAGGQSATQKFLARVGFNKSESLAMDYSDQKYKFKYPATIDGRRTEVQLFYSPVVGRMVVRGVS